MFYPFGTQFDDLFIHTCMHAGVDRSTDWIGLDWTGRAAADLQSWLDRQPSSPANLSISCLGCCLGSVKASME